MTRSQREPGRSTRSYEAIGGSVNFTFEAMLRSPARSAVCLSTDDADGG